jgi:uncharacterized protein (TIGR02246 family)
VPDTATVQHWMEAYQRAWSSNAPSDIAALFTEDAVYFTAPFREPWRGHDEIVAGWLEHRDEPGSFQFRWQPVAVSGDLAVVQGETRYADETYSNLWLLSLGADGRCQSFTEWWMRHPPE